MSETLVREVRFTEAWDKRDPDPKKDYGIHGVDIAFYVKGDKGAVQFRLSTGWLLPETLKLRGNTYDTLYRYNTELHSRTASDCYPMPTDLGYHSLEPRYEGHPSFECDVVEGGKCYYDGSSLNAYEVFAVLLRYGSEGVWHYLESYYRQLFEGEEE